MRLTEIHAELAWTKAKASGPVAHSPEDTDLARRLTPHPIFIVGAHRSGTTLVRNLLDGHPDLCVLPSEGNLLTMFRRRLRKMSLEDRVRTLTRIWIARLVHSDGVPPYWLLGRTTEQRNPYVEFGRESIAWAQCRSIFSHLSPYDAFLPIVLSFLAVTRDGARRHGTRAWVEKTPLHELHLRVSLRRFPHARCVHVVRDPRAVLASRRMLETKVGTHPEDIEGFVAAIASSLRSAVRWSKRLGPSVYHVMRYEDLLSDNKATLERLRAFLDLTDHVALSAPTVVGRPTWQNSSYNRHHAAEPFSTESMHEFRRQLTLQEIALLKRHTARHAEALGYDLSD